MSDSDFKVIDRRSEGRKPEDTKDSTSGPGFTMKEGKGAPGPNEVDFSTFLLSLATSALMYCGEEVPGVKTEKNLELAKQNIELLAILKDKTKGNLTDDEASLLEGLLTRVRMSFVEASKK